MSEDRFLLFDVRTRRAIAETEAVGTFSFTDTLNAPGSWSATIPMDQPHGSGITAATLITPNAVFAYERGEILRSAGPIVTYRVDRRARTISLSGEGWLNLLRRRRLHITKTYAATDQLAIARDLIDYTQTTSDVYDNLGIDLTETFATTVARDRTYFGYEYKSIGTLVEQLAAVNNGFDFRLTPQWSAAPNSTLVVRFGVTFPALGRSTGYTFDLNAVEVTSVDVDMGRYANRATATGLGTGENTPAETVTNAVSLAANITLEDVVSQGDVSEGITLQEYARRRLAIGSVPLTYPTVVLPGERLGEFIPGDQVSCVGVDGILDISGEYRITEIKYDLPADGADTMSLTLVPQAAWEDVS